MSESELSEEEWLKRWKEELVAKGWTPLSDGVLFFASACERHYGFRRSSFTCPHYGLVDHVHVTFVEDEGGTAYLWPVARSQEAMRLLAEALDAKGHLKGIRELLITHSAVQRLPEVATPEELTEIREAIVSGRLTSGWIYES